VVLGCELLYYQPMLALINSLVANKRRNNTVSSSHLYLHVFAHVKDAKKSLEMLRCVFDSDDAAKSAGNDRVHFIVDNRSVGVDGGAAAATAAAAADTASGVNTSSVVSIVHHTFSEQAWKPWVLTANMMKRNGLNSPYNWFRYYLEPTHFAPFAGVRQVLYMDCDVVANADVSPLALLRMGSASDSTSDSTSDSVSTSASASTSAGVSAADRAGSVPAVTPYALGTVELVEPYVQALREHLCPNSRAQRWRWSREPTAGGESAGQGAGLKVGGLATISAGVITIDLHAWRAQRMLERWHANVASNNQSCIWKLQQGALQVLLTIHYTHHTLYSPYTILTIHYTHHTLHNILYSPYTTGAPRGRIFSHGPKVRVVHDE
jgi:hypothetical protein